MIDWPQQLISDIARRRCVPFLGAGVSKQSTGNANAKPPLWDEFLTNALEKCEGEKREITKLLKEKDFLTASHLIVKRMGRADWNAYLESCFSEPNFQAADIHKFIFQIDCPIVASTNVDKIYERYVTSTYEGAAVTKNYSDPDLSRYVRGNPNTRLILKVHGSVDALDKAVFTREDYANAWHSYSSFYDLLKSLVLTNTFLFIGYGLSDPDIQLILENHSRSFKSSLPHYLTLSGKVSDEMKRFYEENYNIKILLYSGKGDHLELTNSLSALVDKVIEKRSALADKQAW